MPYLPELAVLYQNSAQLRPGNTTPLSELAVSTDSKAMESHITTLKSSAIRYPQEQTYARLHG